MSSGFRSFHPLSVFSYYVGAVVLVSLYSDLIYLLAAVIALIVQAYVLTGGERLKRQLTWILLIGAVTFVMNPLLTHRGSGILFYLFDQPITLESIAYGGKTSLFLIAVLVAFIPYNAIITPTKFLYLFSRWAPKAALTVMLATRFLPLFRWRLGEIALVHRTRGMNVREGNLRKRWNDGMKQLTTLLTWSLEEAMQTADSMNARGYGATERTSYETFVFRRTDLAFLAIVFTIIGVCIVGWAAVGYGTMTYYPRLEYTSLTGGNAVFFTSFVLYLCVPAAVEGRERLRWRFLKL